MKFDPNVFEAYLWGTRPVSNEGGKVTICLQTLEKRSEKYSVSLPKERLFPVSYPDAGLQMIKIPTFVRPVFRCGEDLMFGAFIVDEHLPDALRMKPFKMSAQALVWKDDDDIDRLKAHLETLCEYDPKISEKVA